MQAYVLEKSPKLAWECDSSRPNARGAPKRGKKGSRPDDARHAAGFDVRQSKADE